MNLFSQVLKSRHERLSSMGISVKYADHSAKLLICCKKPTSSEGDLLITSLLQLTLL